MNVSRIVEDDLNETQSGVASEAIMLHSHGRSHIPMPRMTQTLVRFRGWHFVSDLIEGVGSGGVEVAVNPKVRVGAQRWWSHLEPSNMKYGMWSDAGGSHDTRLSPLL